MCYHASGSNVSYHAMHVVFYSILPAKTSRTGFALDEVHQLGMKMERKLSDFSAEKRKQNENMETKTEIRGTETETEFFWQKWKQKWNSDFRRNRCGNGSFRFRLIRNFRFMVVLHSQSSKPDI
jgi:hypothetical protein